MKVFFPFTLVQNTPTGMFVANGGETHDLPDDFAQSLIDSGKAEAVADDDAGEPAPAAKPAKPATGKRKAKAADAPAADAGEPAPAASPLDAPVA